jgi:hypothetical protein
MINLQDFTDEFAAPAAQSASSATSAVKAFFQRWHDSIAANRQATAARLVHRHLSRFDDAALAKLGWTPAEVAALRPTNKQTQV